MNDSLFKLLEPSPLRLPPQQRIHSPWLTNLRKELLVNNYNNTIQQPANTNTTPTPTPTPTPIPLPPARPLEPWPWPPLGTSTHALSPFKHNLKNGGSIEILNKDPSRGASSLADVLLDLRGRTREGEAGGGSIVLLFRGDGKKVCTSCLRRTKQGLGELILDSGIASTQISVFDVADSFRGKASESANAPLVLLYPTTVYEASAPFPKQLNRHFQLVKKFLESTRRNLKARERIPIVRLRAWFSSESPARIHRSPRFPSHYARLHSIPLLALLPTLIPTQILNPLPPLQPAPESNTRSSPLLNPRPRPRNQIQKARHQFPPPQHH